MEFRKKLQFTLKDYITFNLFYMKKRLIWTPILFVLIFPAISVIISLIRNDSTWPFMLIGTFIVILLLAGLMTLVNVFSIRRAAKKQYQSSKAMQAESEFIADSAGVRETGEYSSTVVKWEDVYKIMASDTAYYIFISRMQAFLIPKRLITQEEERTLLALLNQYLPAEKVRLR